MIGPENFEWTPGRILQDLLFESNNHKTGSTQPVLVNPIGQHKSQVSRDSGENPARSIGLKIEMWATPAVEK
jgi:hypothetical protein